MRLPHDAKLDIQCFVYYLFKGTLDPRLISAEFDYLLLLLADRRALFNCFAIFACAMRTGDAAHARESVATYILALHNPDSSANLALADRAIAFDGQQPADFWTAFLDLSHLREDYVADLEHCGTDAVPAFAVWTNVIEIDQASVPTNAAWALQRANERLKLWEEEQPAVAFEDWELEQEIY